MNPAKYAAFPLLLAATLAHAGTPHGNTRNPLQAGAGQLPKGEFGRYEGRAVQSSKDKARARAEGRRQLCTKAADLRLDAGDCLVEGTWALELTPSINPAPPAAPSHGGHN